MTTEVHELPEVGEIVVATISKITAHGAYATLDEYNDIQGFLHASEIAHGWVRNINKFVKSGEKKVLLVKRIKEGREEIDLSLKQVSRDQQKKKLVDVKRFEKGKSIIKSVQEKAKLSNSYVEKFTTLAPHIKTIQQACPLFVPLIEENWVNTNTTKEVASIYLKPFLDLVLVLVLLEEVGYPSLLKYGLLGALR